MELGATSFDPVTDAEIKARLRAQQPGGVLRDTPDGPTIDVFDPQKLAFALESEVLRCAQNGWTNVTLTMDVVDAKLLARFLRERTA